MGRAFVPMASPVVSHSCADSSLLSEAKCRSYARHSLVRSVRESSIVSMNDKPIAYCLLALSLFFQPYKCATQVKPNA